MDDTDGYALLVAHVLCTALRDICGRARHLKRGAFEYAMDELANDRGCIYWAESIGIAWPPDARIISDIIEAMRAGEQVWPQRLWFGRD